MVDLLEFRVGKLTTLSGHYRELAMSLFPETVSGEIAAVADAFDDEAMRMKRECLGRRTCPCEMGDSCTALLTYDQLLQHPHGRHRSISPRSEIDAVDCKTRPAGPCA